MQVLYPSVYVGKIKVWIKKEGKKRGLAHPLFFHLGGNEKTLRNSSCREIITTQSERFDNQRLTNG